MTIQCLQKVFTPLHFFTFCCVTAWNYNWSNLIFFSPTHTKYSKMTNWKHVFRNFYKFIQNERRISNLHKVFCSLSQYFVKVPLAAITASSCLGLYHYKLFLDRFSWLSSLASHFVKDWPKLIPWPSPQKGGYIWTIVDIDPSRIVPNSQRDCLGSTNALHIVGSTWLDGWIGVV